MTIGALVAPFSMMHIIGRMARYARRRRPLESIAEMALHTPDFRMTSVQRKGGLVVIELGMLPVLHVMADSAIAPQPAIVRLYALVAGDAFTLGLAKGLTLRMAVLAGQVDMRTAQRKVGLIVVELCTAHFDDVGRSPLMLHVTGAALRAGDVAEVSVKSLLRADVVANVLVTVDAQLRFAGAIAPVMAVRAVLLVFLVSCGQRSGHEQGFRIHGVTGSSREEAQHECHQKKPTPSWRSHRPVGRQYRCTTMTCTMPAMSSMTIKGMWSACQIENSRSKS